MELISIWLLQRSNIDLPKGTQGWLWSTLFKCNFYFHTSVKFITFSFNLKILEMDFQHQFSGNCGNWSHCQRKERTNGEEKWTGCSPLPTIWLSWFQLNNMMPMAGQWRYFALFPSLESQTKNFCMHWNINVGIIFIFNFFGEQIMTPKARGDVHINLPALQKLDSMLIVGGLFISIKPQWTSSQVTLEIHPFAYLKLTGNTRVNG